MVAKWVYGWERSWAVTTVSLKAEKSAGVLADELAAWRVVRLVVLKVGS